MYQLEELLRTCTAAGMSTKNMSEFVVLYHSLCCLITNEKVKITNSYSIDTDIIQNMSFKTESCVTKGVGTFKSPHNFSG